MSAPLPLAHRRLKPGRPRKEASAEASQGRALPERSATPRPATPSRAASPAVPATVPAAQPRLLDLDAAGAYLAVSPWTVRDLIAAGTLVRVRIPLPNGGELRKVLLDREDLDRLVGAWKDRS
jgi:hypothetical protein